MPTPYFHIDNSPRYTNEGPNEIVDLLGIKDNTHKITKYIIKFLCCYNYFITYLKEYPSETPTHETSVDPNAEKKNHTSAIANQTTCTR